MRHPRQVQLKPRIVLQPSGGGKARRLWDGSRSRLHFWPATYDKVLAGAPQRNNGRIEYRCATCGAYFPRKRDAPDEPHIQIDHKRDWAQWVGSKVSPREYTDAAGRTWLAFFLLDVLVAFNDESNLQPMCSTHNAKKSGPKFIDKDVRPVLLR
jgi:hypothetical protein